MAGPAPDDDGSGAFFQAFMAECERLRLSWDDLPESFAFGFDETDGLDTFLEQLRSMAPGVTWRDVFPGMPDDLRGARGQTP